MRGIDREGWERVYTVDTFSLNGFDIYPDFRRNITKYNALVHPIRQDFLRARQFLRIPIRLLFIDGAHQYEDIKIVFNAWEGKVTPGGIIAFHDSLNSPGVTCLITETMYSGKFSRCETLNSKSGLTYITRQSQMKQFRTQTCIPLWKNLMLLLAKNLFKDFFQT